MASVRPTDPVERLVQRGAVSVRPDDTLGTVAEVLRREDIGAALVRDGDGSILGILSERDLVRAWADDEVDLDRDRVADVMTFAPESIDPDLSVSEAGALMLDGGIRHLPLVEDGQPVGLVSMRDVLAVLLDRR